jgi:hypothetical protein
MRSMNRIQKSLLSAMVFIAYALAAPPAADTTPQPVPSDSAVSIQTSDSTAASADSMDSVSPSAAQQIDTAGYTVYDYDTHRNRYTITSQPKDRSSGQPVSPGQPIYAPVQQSYPPVRSTKPASTTATSSARKSSSFDDYILGKQDGQREAIGNPGWIFAGLAGTYFCLCIGCAGIGLAFVVPPNPSVSALIGKSTSYIKGYNEGYKSKTRLKNALYASVGCGIAALINFIIGMSIGNSETMTF